MARHVAVFRFESPNQSVMLLRYVCAHLLRQVVGCPPCPFLVLRGEFGYLFKRVDDVLHPVPRVFVNVSFVPVEYANPCPATILLQPGAKSNWRSRRWRSHLNDHRQGDKPVEEPSLRVHQRPPSSPVRRAVVPQPPGGEENRQASSGHTTPGRLLMWLSPSPDIRESRCSGYTLTRSVAKPGLFSCNATDFVKGLTDLASRVTLDAGRLMGPGIY
jgi:hypothetical protein